MDITNPSAVNGVLDALKPELLVHAAAYTDVRRAEQEREKCWEVNVEGTRNVVRSCLNRKLFLIHISTDYVFEGTRGMYREEDTVGPVQNYYALTKLIAEELVRLAPLHLVIRTSFRPSEWPYPIAFTDLFTSQDYIDVIAPEVALAIRRYREIPYNTLHIGTERKSAYELAKRRSAEVQSNSKQEASVALPEDISLDSRRWQELKARWQRF